MMHGVEDRGSVPTQRHVRTILIDDHTAFAEALAVALSAQSDITVVGCAATPWAARALLDQQVNVAVIDLQFGGHDALELAREIRLLAPSIALVLMSDTPDALVLETMLSLGARGFVHKGQGVQHIIDAVRSAETDQIALPAAMFTDFVSRSQGRSDRTRASDRLRMLLTERECEILTLMAEGHSTRDIAARLVLSVNTVRSHVQNTLTKLGVNSRLQAVALAREAGLFGRVSGNVSGEYGVTRVERRRQT